GVCWCCPAVVNRPAPLPARRHPATGKALSQSRRMKVQAAVKRIRQFYALGRRIIRREADEPTRRGGVIREEAERLGRSQDTVRKARQFATEDVGYTRRELKELCRTVMEMQPAQPADLAVVGLSCVIRLLTVRPKARRARLQRRFIKEGWTVAEVEAEIATRCGPRREGGRRRPVPRHPPGPRRPIPGVWQA